MADSLVQLQQAEEENRRFLNEPIPQRRFGTSVTSADQQAVLRRRQQAADNIRRIQEERERITRERAEIEAAQKAQEDFQAGQTVARNDGSPVGLNYAARQGFKSIQEEGKLSQAEYDKRLKRIQFEKAVSEGAVGQRADGSYIYGTPVTINTPQMSLGNDTRTVGDANRALLERLGIDTARGVVVLPANENISKIEKTYQKAEAFFSKKFSQPVAGGLRRIGVTSERVGQALFGSPTRPDRPLNKFQRGAIAGTTAVAEDLTSRPLKNVLIVGAGAAVGAGTKGVGVVVKATAPKARLITELGLTGVGAGIIDKEGRRAAKEYKKLTSPEQKGSFIAIQAKDFALFGTGTALGIKGFTKAADFKRFVGKPEVAQREIIAKEYFAGERFPKIKRGQTAGGLRKEFFEPIPALGETGNKPTLTTALPNEPATVQTTGSSEVFGGYGAPKGSPQFLGVIEGERVIPLSFLVNIETTRPTVVRTQVKRITFAPGVRPEQRSLRKLDKPLLQFFGGGRSTGLLGTPQAARGTAVIPFIKTEKEAVIPFGTKFTDQETIGFFKFNNRKVGVVRQKAVFEPIEVREVPKVKRSTRQIETIESSSRGGKGRSSGALDPFSSSIVSYSRASGLSSSISSFRISSSSSFNIPSSTSKPILPSSSTTPRSSRSSLPSPSLTRLPSLPSSKPILSFRSTPKSSKSRSFGFDRKGESFAKASRGFRTFFVQRGKKKYISGVRPRGLALEVGERKALGSLRATFGIEPTPISVKSGPQDYAPSTTAFRAYKIKGGKRVQLRDTFIQRRGRRLASIGELREIQAARSLRGS